jgi:hypothetical protein
MKIKLLHVHHMPKHLEPGILYVSEEYGAVAHLCPCGCGSRIRTPLGPTGWALEVTPFGPTLYPSIGNWQQACQSHYWIYQGEIIWADKWTPAQIAAGRRREEGRRRAYYGKVGIIQKIWRWLRNIAMEFPK